MPGVHSTAQFSLDASQTIPRGVLDTLPLDGVMQAPPDTRPPSPKSAMLWQTLNQKHIHDFISMDDPDQALRFLASILKYTDFETDLRSSILLDYNYFNLMFAKECSFNEEKTSIFFTIMKTILDKALSTKCTMEECFAEFKGLVLRCCFKRGPASFRLFTLEDAKLTTDHAANTLFKHWRLYQYVAQHDRDIERFRRHVFVETAAVCAPLSSALPPELPKQPEAPPKEEPPKKSPDAEAVDTITAQLEQQFGSEVDGIPVKDIRFLVNEAVLHAVKDLQDNLQRQEDTLLAKLAELDTKVNEKQEEKEKKPAAPPADAKAHGKKAKDK